jgi:NTP pyrophosphatase (non-canonical NTP hydrolase)
MDVDTNRLDELILEIRNLTVSKGWRDNGAEGDRTGPWFAAYIALLHSEASEALEAYRDKIWSDSKKVQTRKAGGKILVREVDKPIGVGPELADVLIRVLDMCDIWDIDIQYELKRVLEFGWTRPYQHGGKTLLWPTGRSCGTLP